jgi:hypothetical protein
MKRIATLTALLLTALTHAIAQSVPVIQYDIESNFQQTQTLPPQ